MTRRACAGLLVAFLLGAATLAAVPAHREPRPHPSAAGVRVASWRTAGSAGRATGPTPRSGRGGSSPGIAARDYACIPQGSDVVVDKLTSRIDLDVLELGRGPRLTLQPGTALYVWGDQDQVRSITKRDSLIEVDGATLGGGGRLHVIGTVDIHRSSTGGAPR